MVDSFGCALSVFTRNDACSGGYMSLFWVKTVEKIAGGKKSGQALRNLAGNDANGNEISLIFTPYILLRRKT